MEELKIAKDRLLNIYGKLVEGKTIYKEEEIAMYGCSPRSFQRDIDDLRTYFSNQSIETGVTQELIYDRKIKGYRLVPPIRNVLSNEEVKLRKHNSYRLNGTFYSLSVRVTSINNNNLLMLFNCTGKLPHLR